MVKGLLTAVAIAIASMAVSAAAQQWRPEPMTDNGTAIEIFTNDGCQVIVRPNQGVDLWTSKTTAADGRMTKMSHSVKVRMGLDGRRSMESQWTVTQDGFLVDPDAFFFGHKKPDLIAELCGPRLKALPVRAQKLFFGAYGLAGNPPVKTLAARRE
ncbi:MAG TPA: hypothetical protein VMT99_01105 [Candidatus Paceibacterota bacterium]|nr:hypothetical protein [Candidatus Paceibacterota bacterium]